MSDTFTHAGLTVTIEQDDDAPNPRHDYDHLATLALYHRRYDLGDKHKPDMDDLPDIINEPGCVALPVWMYDHSGISFSCGRRSYPYDCPWDSGQAGYAYIDRATWTKEYGWNRLTKQRREQLETYITGEVEEYDQWSRGEVYWFSVTDDDGEHLDSCGGFIGYDNCKEFAIEAADHAATERTERLSTERNLLAEALAQFNDATSSLCQ